MTRIVRFTPTTVSKNVGQVRAQFSAPMIPLGDPRAITDLFAIQCPVGGYGHWLDSRTWAYDFKQTLPGGITCTFRLRPEIKSLDGAGIGGQTTFTFSTGGPAVVTTWPGDGEAIEPDQDFALMLDGEANVASVVAHAAFEVKGLPQRVGVRLVTGADRQAIIDTIPKDSITGPIVVVAARQRFPDGAPVSLIWGAGIVSPTGVATTGEQAIKFKVKPPLTATMRCTQVNAHSNCVPLTPIQVEFSSAVPLAQAMEAVLVGPDGSRIAPHHPASADPMVHQIRFDGPFREEATYHIQMPLDLRDGSGRPLSNASDFPMAVKTDPLPPLAKFAARFGIIEAADPVLPVTLRNLEPEVAAEMTTVTNPASNNSGTLKKLIENIEARVWRVPPEDLSQVVGWLRKVALAKRTGSVFAGATGPLTRFKVPKPNGAKAFEVVGIPLKRPGLYVVELASPTLGAALLDQRKPMYVPTAALVTNLAVHFKWGAQASIVWVTSLDDARPVEGATVTVADCGGKSLWSGVTDHRGIASIDHLPVADKLPTCSWPDQSRQRDFNSGSNQALANLDSGLLVAARLGDDLSLVHSSWSQGLESWRFNLPGYYGETPLLAHTVTDRALLRAGETLHMKHFIRWRVMAGFGQVPAEKRPNLVSLQHRASDQHYDFPINFADDGIALTDWQIPLGARLGTYDVVLIRRPPAQGTATPAQSDQPPPQEQWTAGEFRVEEFRVPLMKGTVGLPPTGSIGSTSMPVTLALQYLSGGPARNYPVVLRSQLTPNSSPSFPDFDSFTFANGRARIGLVRTDVETPDQTAGVHQKLALKLDAAGTASAQITDIPQAVTPTQVRAEMEFRDPNGETKTVSNTALVFPAQWLVGISHDGWLSSPKRIRVRLAVVDISGHPISNVKISADLFRRDIYSIRKRLVGGFYAYQSMQDTKLLQASFCSGLTDKSGVMTCEGKPPTTGNLVLQATVSDPQGRSSVAHTDMWINGDEQQWFGGNDDDRIDVLPEKASYEPGETARLQVRMPFSRATVLVTIEREGVRDAAVMTLEGRDPAIDVPIRGYAPNIFISVLAVRGRIAAVQPTAMIDLGKPAFRLGIAQLKVGWRDHDLKVAVTPDRAVYHVREKSLVKIAVAVADGHPLPEGSEVAVAAVDEGLLELAPNHSWELLNAMMGQRGYQVQTSTSQLEVVGKRHFGLKAVPQGGGGGRQPTRELFDTLLLWQPRVKLDANGQAMVEVALNDSLTSFRIVAVASAGDGLFGTGSASIRSTQDLMVLAGLPPLVRAGDRYQSEFTARNTTPAALSVTLKGKVGGLAQPLPPISFDLAAGSAKVVGWPIAVPSGVSRLSYDIEASSGAGHPSDHLKIDQRVIPLVPVVTTQTTLLRLDKPTTETVERPGDALSDEGGIRVTLSPSLSGSALGTVRQWMKDYPFSCLEQQVSRSVALDDGPGWDKLTRTLPAYQDSNGLFKYFSSAQEGSEILTSYILSITAEAGLALPDAVARAASDGLQAFVEGRLKTASLVQAPDLPMRKLAALEALSRVGKATPKMLGSLTLEPELWPTSALLDWWSVLLRVKQVPQRDKRLAQAQQLLRARMVWEGNSLGFSTSQRDQLWWLMASPDTNAVRLPLLALESGEWPDVPRLMLGALQRQRNGAWPETTADAWGVLALKKFAAKFEAAPVAGSTTGKLAGQSQRFEWTTAATGGTLDFAWPSGAQPLELSHDGSGVPWVQVQPRAAIVLSKPLIAGYRISRAIAPIERRTPGHLSRGDVVEVRLTITAQNDLGWVVLQDPVPTGASYVGTGLGHDSQIMASLGAQQNTWPTFEEHGLDSYRAYYDYLPQGSFTVSYMLRLNQAGHFGLPPTRVEALYEPAAFGEAPNDPLDVAP